MSGSSFQPTFALDRRAVVVGSLLYVGLLTVPVVDGDVATWVYFAGLPVGVVVGALTPRYGSAMNNGVTTTAIGILLLAVGAFVYGSAVSYQLGWGVDSLLALNIGTRGLVILFVVTPLHLLEVVAGAIAGQGLRSRVRQRWAAE